MSDLPKRVQMNHDDLWKQLFPDAVRVDRMTQWGNPYAEPRNAVTGLEYEFTREQALRKFAEVVLLGEEKTEPEKAAFEKYYVEPLRGKDLACWCPEGYPCHADLWLAYVNGTYTDVENKLDEWFHKCEDFFCPDPRCMPERAPMKRLPKAEMQERATWLCENRGTADHDKWQQAFDDFCYYLMVSASAITVETLLGKLDKATDDAYRTMYFPGFVEWLRDDDYS